MNKNITNRRIISWMFVFLWKTAHIAEYAILAVLLWNALRYYVKNKRRLFILSVTIAVAYASIDKLHQYFVTGRDGRVTDVLIDGIGALIGV